MRSFERIKANVRRNRLFKDPHKGIVFGVCAGLANYLGLQPWLVRVAVLLLALLVWTEVTVVAYLIAALVLNKKPRERLDAFYDRFGDRFGDRYGRRS
ncbi:MAG TPA: PspC domain-containing protein [Azospirillaceae bacterium]|nr:PspC domain-containing protein [Azospirillaceae bacterium]